MAERIAAHDRHTQSLRVHVQLLGASVTPEFSERKQSGSPLVCALCRVAGSYHLHQHCVCAGESLLGEAKVPTPRASNSWQPETHPFALQGHTRLRLHLHQLIQPNAMLINFLNALQNVHHVPPRPGRRPCQPSALASDVPAPVTFVFDGLEGAALDRA